MVYPKTCDGFFLFSKEMNYGGLNDDEKQKMRRNAIDEEVMPYCECPSIWNWGGTKCTRSQIEKSIPSFFCDGYFDERGSKCYMFDSCESDGGTISEEKGKKVCTLPLFESGNMIAKMFEDNTYELQPIAPPDRDDMDPSTKMKLGKGRFRSHRLNVKGGSINMRKVDQDRIKSTFEDTSDGDTSFITGRTYESTSSE